MTLDSLQTTEGVSSSLQRIVLSGFSVYHTHPSLGARAAENLAKGKAADVAAALNDLLTRLTLATGDVREAIVPAATLIVTLTQTIRERLMAAALGMPAAVGVEIELDELVFTLTQLQLKDACLLFTSLLQVISHQTPTLMAHAT